jgi:quercetin dioxygenase-like cupin family protein
MPEEDSQYLKDSSNPNVTRGPRAVIHLE